MKTTQRSLGKKTVFVLLFLASMFTTQAATLYVKSTAAGANNGTSWANAYTTLQSALAAAVSGDQIWVASGVYKPSAQVDVDASGGIDAREVTFQLPSGVKIYGGFAGTEATLAERNWTTNLTILSGDIDNNDTNGDANFIDETTSDIVGNNAYHVVYTSNVTAATQLDGFIITAGRAYLAAPPNPNVPNLDGGGWYNRISAPQNASSPTIRNCTFQGNYADSDGAGFYTTPGTIFVTMVSEIRACKFIQNKSNFSAGAIFLGSFVAGNYQPVIAQCEFTGNQAYRRGGAIYFIGDHAQLDTCTFQSNSVTVVADGVTKPGSGGAVTMTASNTAFRKCLFIGNSSTGNATGAYEGGGGGAVYMSTNEIQTTSLGESKPKFTSCGFYNNTAEGNTVAWGGAAVHLNDAGKLTAVYVNCVFSGNHAQHDGGAVASFTRVISAADGFIPVLRTDFTNCTFYANTAGRNGGGIFNDGYVHLGSQVLSNHIENTILYGNTAVTSGPQIHNDATGISAVSYSLVQGSGGSGGGWSASVGTDGGHNLDASPVFVTSADPDGVDNQPGTADDGLRLQMGSSAINAGSNAFANLAGVTKDFAGNNRIQNSSIDMGAYERYSFVIPGIKLYWLSAWKIVRPVCLSCPWAIRLNTGINEKPQHFVWQSTAQLRDYGDYAEIVGTIVSQENRSMQFDVYLKLVKPQDWNAWSAQRHTYKANTLEAQKAAFFNHRDWTYWILSDESYLKGKGTVRGTLQLQHSPSTVTTGFQLGVGGNAQDADMGLSGEFSYRGVIEYKGLWYKNSAALKGTGSLNVDAELCTQDCDQRTARTGETLENNLAEGLPTVSVYPNPARDWVMVELAAGATSEYTIQLYNFQGQRLQPSVTTVEPGRKRVNIKGFASGLYYLKVTDEMGHTQQHKVVIE